MSSIICSVLRHNEGKDVMTEKCAPKTEATASGGSPRVKSSLPGPDMRVFAAVVDKNRMPAERRRTAERIFAVLFPGIGLP
jgi:hypothetical protein